MNLSISNYKKPFMASCKLASQMAPNGYYEVTHTRTMAARNLIVDISCIKYVGDEHAKQLINILQQHYALDIDWSSYVTIY